MHDNASDTCPQEQPGICPKCGAGLIYHADGITILDNYLGRAVLCVKSTCDFSGNEWHRTTFESFTDKDGNSIEPRRADDGQA